MFFVQMARDDYLCLMSKNDVIDLMMHHGVKPTANRILICEAMRKAGRPVSMGELELFLEPNNPG